ncbi:MAG: hypothetical protein WBA44_06065 [Mesorhizobium sp.]
MNRRRGDPLTRSDFASLLEEVIASAEQKEAEDIGARPTIPFDLMGTVIDVEVTDPSVAAEYLFAAADRFSIVDTSPTLAPTLGQELPSIEPEDIRRELGITPKDTPESLDRLRRRFALANHPDRVSGDLADRALQRMKIANQLIDEGKQRFLKVRD